MEEIAGGADGPAAAAFDADALRYVCAEHRCQLNRPTPTNSGSLPNFVSHFVKQSVRQCAST